MRVDCKRTEGKGHKDSLFAYSKSILAVNAVFGKYPNATLARPEIMSCLDCRRDHPLHVFPVGMNRSENINRPPGGNSTLRWGTSEH